MVETTLGAMLVAATDKGVCRLAFNEGESELRARFPRAELVEGGEQFRTLFAAGDRGGGEPRHRAATSRWM